MKSRKQLVAALIAGALAIDSAQVLAATPQGSEYGTPGYGPGMMYGYSYGYSPWMHGAWMFGGGLMAIFWIVVLALAVGFVVHLMKRLGDASAGRVALDILEERYARGEIEKDEFDRRKRDLA